MKSSAYLLLGGLLLWGLAYFPCQWLGGENAVLQSAAALGLCLLPALATLLWASWAFRNSPEMQLLAVLGGSFFRMAFALGGAWVLMRSFPDLYDETLWALLIIFYLGVLGLEIGIMVSQAGKKQQQTQSS